jgi:acyl-CoA dehydrogenase
MTLFYLPLKGVNGITTTFLEEMGRDGVSWGNMHIDNVRIPRHYVIGQENKGFYIVHEGYEFARCLVALVCVGAASKSLENAMTYMKSRKTFGSSIASHEGLQFPLAEDYIKIEAARLLAYKALWMYQGEQKAGRFQRFEVTKAIAMAKAVAPTWAFEAINDAMQWQGAFGYSKECPEQKALRGIRSFGFAEGTVEIMKLIVARELLGREHIAYRQ